MAAMTSEVCLAWSRFTQLPPAKDILSGPKPSVNTPIRKPTLHAIVNTCVSHVRSHMFLVANAGSAVMVSPSLLFTARLRRPNAQLKCVDQRMGL